MPEHTIDAAERRIPLWWRFAKAVSQRSFARQLARLALEGYLRETGWTRSARGNCLVNAAGEPLPWMTFPFIDFITPRLGRNFCVFEYGAGSSTLFFAQRVKEVYAVEHDEAFAAGLQPTLPPNARLVVHPRGSDAYVQAVAELPAPPDIVIVDGRDRVRCACAAYRRLGPGGVLVLDDSERAEYASAAAELAEAGFRRLDFWGIAPGQTERRCTTVFYRPENVLGL